MQQLLVKDPAKRMTIEEAFDHDWLVDSTNEILKLPQNIIDNLNQKATLSILRKEVISLYMGTIDATTLLEWNRLYDYAY